MMIKIWNEENNPKYFLRLCEAENKDEHAVCLIITNNDGTRVAKGNVLVITQDGELKICTKVNIEIAKIMGLRLDTDGRIVVANDDD